MKCFTISLPDDIAQASNITAKSLGISRTEFIRQAVVHELSNRKREVAQQEIIECFNHMKASKSYMKEAKEIIDGLSEELPEEGEEWWNKT